MRTKAVFAILITLSFAFLLDCAVAHSGNTRSAPRPAPRAAPRAAPGAGARPMAGPGRLGQRPGVGRMDDRGRAGFARRGFAGHRGFDRGFAGHRFGGRDFHHFSARDRELWRRGAWHREFHDGRYGWWWFAGGAWYFYAQPVYPYPVVVSQDVYSESVEAAPAEEAPPPVVIAPAPRFRYYCDSPAGYYPAVASCAAAFRKVPVP